MKKNKLLGFIIIFLMVSLAGCDNVENPRDLKEKIEKQKSIVVGQVEPFPKFKKNDQYTYQNINQKNPFQMSMIAKSKVPEKVVTDVKPDENRVKETLEIIDLDSFKMVGTLKKGKEELEAILSDSSNNLNTVHVGNYIGKNNGKIIKINEDSIDVVEIVPNGNLRWLERPVTIKLTMFEEEI